LLVFLFSYGLFNETISSLGCIGLNNEYIYVCVCMYSDCVLHI